MECFINFITSSDYDFTLPSPLFDLSFQYIFKSHLLETWTVHSLDSLNLFISADSDLIQWNTGYLRLFGKHQSLVNCMLFLLLRVSFNDTITALQRSGYGRSSTAMFFINEDYGKMEEDSELLLKFQDFPLSVLTSGLNISSEEIVFHAGITFFNLESPYILSYCYFCPSDRGKFHKMKWNNEVPVWFAFNALRARDFELNKLTSHNQVRVIIYTLLVEDGRRDISSLFNSLPGRVSYMSRVKFPTVRAPAEFPSILYKLNVTNWEVRAISDITSEEEVLPDDRFWHLNIAWGELAMLKVHNSLLQNRAQFMAITHQHKLQAFYCLEKDAVMRVNWNLFLLIFDLPTWVTIIISIVVYSRLQYPFKLTTGLDLAWLMIDMQCWYKHPRKLLAAYLISILFLACIIQSGVSDQFITLDNVGHSVLDLVKDRYRFIIPSYMRPFVGQLAMAFKTSGLDFTWKPFRPILGEFTTAVTQRATYSVTTSLLLNPSGLLHEMTRERLIRIMARAEDPLSVVMHAVQGTDGSVLLENHYWCRATSTDSFTLGLNLGSSLRIWNMLAERGFKLFSMLLEGGFTIREDKLKLTYILSQRNVSWEIVGKENKANSIKLVSPVGFALFGLAFMNIVVLLNFFISISRTKTDVIENTMWRIKEGAELILGWLNFYQSDKIK